MIQASCVTDSRFANLHRLLSCYGVTDDSEGITGMLADLSGTHRVDSYLTGREIYNRI